MHLDQPFDQRQPQSEPSAAAVEGLVALHEGLKQARQNLGRDAGPVVADVDGGDLALGRQKDPRASIPPGELRRIIHEVADHLGQARRVAADPERLRRTLHLEGDAVDRKPQRRRTLAIPRHRFRRALPRKGLARTEAPTEKPECVRPRDLQAGNRACSQAASAASLLWARARSNHLEDSSGIHEIRLRTSSHLQGFQRLARAQARGPSPRRQSALLARRVGHRAVGWDSSPDVRRTAPVKVTESV